MLRWRQAQQCLWGDVDRVRYLQRALVQLEFKLGRVIRPLARTAECERGRGRPVGRRFVRLVVRAVVCDGIEEPAVHDSRSVSDDMESGRIYRARLVRLLS